MSVGPRYLRKRSSDATTSTNVDNEYPEYPEARYLKSHKKADLNVTGLREKKLLALIIWLSVLLVLALILLICNIMIINVLQMSHYGMKAFKIYSYENEKTHEEESIVHFTAQKSYFEEVTVESGRVFGPKNSRFTLQGSRVIVGQPTEPSTKLLLQDGKCRFENTDQFLVLSSTNSKTLFSAQHPLVSIDNKIKQLSASHIITNKVRSPVNEKLLIDAENVVIRGNEGIEIESRVFNVTADTIISFNTSSDGNIHLGGRYIYFGSQRKTLSMSSSPALSASVEAFRLCVCKTSVGKAKLFLVNGNRQCMAPGSLCK
uniref:Beta-sarcoglycan n=1 Tax=Panagrellus redivivus TaxID=6233 RepID=A0A7E4VFS2_PANRE